MVLTSCIETVIAGTAATTVLVTREKTVENTKSDIVIATTIGIDFLENGLKTPGNSVDITVNEGRVLLTGIVRDPQKAELANSLAWKAEGVKEVIDEIEAREEPIVTIKDIKQATKDYSITLQIESKLLLDSKIATLNFKVTTVNGVVYLLGVAQNNGEMNKVINISSKVRGVKRVVNNIILKNDSRRHAN